MQNGAEFYWERHPEVESLFLHYIHHYCGGNDTLADFSMELARCSSSSILNWIDHIRVADSSEFRDKLRTLGFEREESVKTPFFAHRGVLLPAVVLVGGGSASNTGIALAVENIEEFCSANRKQADIEGLSNSPYREALIASRKGARFWVVERRGVPGIDPSAARESHCKDYRRGLADWAGLDRSAKDEDGAWRERNRLAGDLVSRLGAGPAACLVCRCERDFWLSRNGAGRAQKTRQDLLGVGWANHDHHTFRSSRRNFSRLINVFLTLGFQKRERFYAGEEAGWGAQVMEHPAAGLTLFLDVDLAPEEVDIDFSLHDLEEKDTLGTVGLWCALHGDSIFEAGMHHLAARFDFERLTEDLAKQNVRFMPPFSDFPYLKQAFSLAEIWPVSTPRIRNLLSEKRIDEEQAEIFREKGSVGSHIENIERKEGYKGFNRKNVSAIIRDTDPRKRRT